MKRLVSVLLITAWLLSALPVFAKTEEPVFSFRITIDGAQETVVSTGDTVTVTVELHKTDKQTPYPMYAMQTEICYDGSFFRLIKDSVQNPDGVMTTDLALGGSYRAFYLNYLSFGGGTIWEPEVTVGSFQLEIIGTTGISRIFSRNSMVCKEDGNGSYPIVGYDAKAVCSQTCAVTFDTRGGGAIFTQYVKAGERVIAPQEPFRAGYRFAGWCTDADCTQRWQFSETPVTENLYLFAKWEKDKSAVMYSDVQKSDWFFLPVQYVSERGLMSGVGDGRFAPEAQTSRAMIVTILWRLEGQPSAQAEHTFADVPAGQWYSDAVCWAAEQGIVNGYSAQQFAPDDPITREQIAAILYRYACYRGVDCTARADLSLFADADKIQSWAVEALTWANAMGLINGVGGNRLEPQSFAIRCQTAAILQRFCSNYSI